MAHRRAYGVIQALGVAWVSAQDLFQIAGMFIAQAQQQTPFDRHPDAIAGAAEIMAMGRDETDANVRRFRQAPIAGGPLGGFGGFDQGEPLGDACAHLIA
ncbi:hypothetical protein D3C86_1631360 [compost metagenome]